VASLEGTVHKIWSTYLLIWMFYGFEELMSVHAWKSERANGLERTNELLHAATCWNDTICSILNPFGFTIREIKY
jgi:hypothetical protein